MVSKEKLPVNFFEQFPTLQKEFRRKEGIFFLDYDGTLTPIVATPDLAVLHPKMRDTIQRLARLYTVAIVSGRATDDVRGKVNIKGIFYAGSHGFEIVNPAGAVTVNDEVQTFRPIIDEVHRKLSERLKDVPGALVEHVKYTISSHYRLVSEKDFVRVKQAVEDILRDYPQLRKTDGKKVFEIRPVINWDKGKAVEWILRVLTFDPSQHIPLYIGDDTTDEDAFRALKAPGFGILVAQQPRESLAAYRIKDTAEVQKVLEAFIAMKNG